MIPFYITTIDFATPAYDEFYQLRHDILRKPINQVFYIIDIEQEYNDIHLVAFHKYEEHILGGLVLTTKADNMMKVRQVVVSNAYQGKGIGRAIAIESEKLCRSLGYSRIELHARESAIPFYLSLGYSPMGKTFSEVGIPHQKMYKEL